MFGLDFSCFHRPLGNIRWERLRNWQQVLEEAELDFVHPMVIWNDYTRQDLINALRTETEELDKALLAFPNVAITWNYEDFAVQYRALSDQLRVSDYYLEELVNSAGLVLEVCVCL